MLQKFLEDFRYAQFLPKMLENQSQTDFSSFCQQFALSGENQPGLFRKPGQRAHQAFNVAFGIKPIQSAKRRNNTLHYFGAFPPIFHNLSVQKLSFGLHLETSS